MMGYHFKLNFAQVFFLCALVMGPLVAAPDYEAALEKGETETEELLRAVPADSTYHPWAIVESAKLFYRQERWTRFFGIAAYTRMTMTPTKETEGIATLEILALIRHCQFRKAYQRYLSLKKTPVFNQANRSVVANWVALLPVAKIVTDTNDKSKAPSGILPKKHEWPVSVGKSELQNMDPYSLRVPIQAMCERRPS